MPSLRRDSRQRRPLLPRLRTCVRRQRRPSDLYRAGGSSGASYICRGAYPNRYATQQRHASVNSGLGSILSAGASRNSYSSHALDAPAEANSPTGRGQANRHSCGHRQTLPLPGGDQICRFAAHFRAKRPKASAGGRTDADFAAASWGHESVSAQAPAVAQAEAWPRDLCPLCQAPLRPDQNWCLRCGAAARTRLAAQPKWKALVTVLLLVVVLSLGVLAAALVKLAG